MTTTNIELTKDRTIKLIKSDDKYLHFFEYDNYNLLEHIKCNSPYTCKTINHHNKEVEYIDKDKKIKIILQVKPKRVYTDFDIMRIIMARKRRRMKDEPITNCALCKLKTCNKKCFANTVAK